MLRLACIGALFVAQTAAFSPAGPLCGSVSLRSQATCRTSRLASPLRSSAAIRPPVLRMAATLDQNGVDMQMVDEPRYITKAEALQIDQELMSEQGGFSLDHLMEMAGHSVADAIFEAYPPSSIGAKRVLVLVGKGNNGGDALVTARWLHHYGYQVGVVFPERPRGPTGELQPWKGLQQQCRNLNIQIPYVQIYSSLPGFVDQVGLIVDGVFGFSFEGNAPRAPWDYMFKQLTDPEQFGRIPIVSIDIPSGWHADTGMPVQPTAEEIAEGAKTVPVLNPAVLVSLTAPKMGVAKYNGLHYLGLRTIPFSLKSKYDLDTPSYVGSKTYTRLSKLSQETIDAIDAKIARENLLSTSAAAVAEAVSAPAAAAPSVVAAPAPVVPPPVVPVVPPPAPVVEPAAAAPVAAAAAAVAAVPEPAPAAAPIESTPYKYGNWQWGQDNPMNTMDVNKMLMPPMPDEATDEALEEITGQLVDFVNEKGPYWDLEIRNLLSSRVVPIAEETNWPPYRTTCAKLCFVGAKAIVELGKSVNDFLPDGRKFAEQAFEQDGDMEAGKILQGMAKLFEAQGGEENMQAAKEIEELVARVTKERQFPEDLEEGPPKPAYRITDKWTISLRSPDGVGDDEPLDLVVRPVQKARLLLKAWLGANDFDESQIDEFGLEVPKEPETWKNGVVDLEEPIGESGAEDLSFIQVFVKAEREKAAAEESA